MPGKPWCGFCDEQIEEGEIVPPPTFRAPPEVRFKRGVERLRAASTEKDYRQALHYLRAMNKKYGFDLPQEARWKNARGAEAQIAKWRMAITTGEVTKNRAAHYIRAICRRFGMPIPHGCEAQTAQSGKPPISLEEFAKRYAEASDPDDKAHIRWHVRHTCKRTGLPVPDYARKRQCF